jgi:Flp pilus assembly protein TadD
MSALVLLGVLGGLLLLPGPAVAAECVEWVALVVSTQGPIDARRRGDPGWRPVASGEQYCLGDTIRVAERGRAAIRLRNESMLRLDQGTTVTFVEPPGRPAETWIELVGRSIVHFLSRVPRRLRVITPFVNGTIEGTEFVMEVGEDRTRVTVFEGRVVAENPAGRLELASGQSAEAVRGRPPQPVLIARPRDLVRWALYYPSVADARPADFPDLPGEDWPALVRRSIEAYRRGDLGTAFAALDRARPDIRDPRFYTYRATLLLAVGRVGGAEADLGRALALRSRDARALALLAIVSVAQNETREALRLAGEAVAADPASAAAHVALSYARQATFDLDGALASLEAAVAADPASALAWARLSEIRLAFGRMAEALAAAGRATALDPTVARTQSVLGFAHLARIDLERARQAFERAIQLDQADPLPRLGLGLTKIRRGDLGEGRRDLETAASLDPDNALVRSYLGKAYYEERRDGPAAAELATARTLDPNDPTPWFYDAIRQQSVNRPVEALQSLQQAIALNDGRAVYRSRLLLDEDLAARSASLAQIYDDLGFQQRALAEGWRSLGLDPASYPAHRFLADSYATLPRHDVARQSELLQAQLLQPLDVNAIQARLAVTDQFILDGAGPSTVAFNEFNALFNRNRLFGRASGVAGSNGTLGDELAVAAVWNNVAFSLNQFHFETDGFRDNNDLSRDIYSIFAQVDLAPRTSVQAELRTSTFDRGDLLLRFDPDNFSPTLRQEDEVYAARVGARHGFGPASAVLGTVAYQRADIDTDDPASLTIHSDLDTVIAELQHLWRTRPLGVVSGIGYYHAAIEDRFVTFDETLEERIDHGNAYVYASLNLVRDLTLTLGLSADFVRSAITDENQVNPKAGLVWTPLRGTTLRAAGFRTLKRELISSQTLEPTQVAGFNQFFDDAEGTDAWRYGAGIDQSLLSGRAFVGAEASARRTSVPFINVDEEGIESVTTTTWNESLVRAYAYWTPLAWVAVAAEYFFETFDRGNPLDEGIKSVQTHRVPLTLSLFHPLGPFARLGAMYVDQHGKFESGTGQLERGHDAFWVVDAAVGYRLPRRLGIVSVEARNLLDQRFRFQETDPVRPLVYPERLILGRATLAY